MSQQAIQQIQDELYISNSPIFCYQNCSLKYKFQYLEQRPAERISSALLFGKQIHSILEFYYCEARETGQIPVLDKLQQLFAEGMIHQVEGSEVPVIYKKEAPDLDSLINMGKGLVTAFYEGVDLSGMEVVAVEVPLTAPLYDEHGNLLDIKLFGIIDLLLKDTNKNLIVVDHKTAKQKQAQSSYDQNVQMTVYSYLLACNRYVFPKADVQCRFDLLRKLKTPKFETVLTERGPEQRKKFSKLASAVLAGIDNRVFIPCKSWLCSDCQYASACHEEW